MDDKTFAKLALRHGEVILKPVTDIPKQAEQEGQEMRRYTVAHSESSHHHEVVADLQLFAIPGTSRRFINVKTDGELQHLKSGKDKHKTLKLFKGPYEVIEKFAYNPFTKLRERVRD